MLEIDRVKLKAVGEKHRLEFVVLFGSQTTNQTHAGSDVDIAYFPPPAFTDDDRLYLDLLDVVRRNDLDLVNLKQVSPLLLKKIIDQSLVLYERCPGAFDDFVLYVFRLHRDTFPLRRLEKDYVIRQTQLYTKQLNS